MHCCKMMEHYLGQEDRIVDYWPKFREFGIPVHDGGSSHIVIEYCPWCGVNLPRSLRDEWFDILDSINMELDDENLPEDMKSDKWWSKKYGAGALPQKSKPPARGE